MELVITIILVSILLAALSLTYLGGLKTVSQITRGGVKGEVGRAFINMAEELRQVTSLTTTQAANLIFTLDSNSDGIDETVQYVWSGVAGSALNRVQSSPPPAYTVPLVNSVSSLSFSYYDASNNLLDPPTPAQVRGILVNLTVTSGNETFQLRSTVKLRTL